MNISDLNYFRQEIDELQLTIYENNDFTGSGFNASTSILRRDKMSGFAWIHGVKGASAWHPASQLLTYSIYLM